MGAAALTHIVRNHPKLKLVHLPTPADLSEESLSFALEILQAERDGWADIVVHQSELRRAHAVARAHNAKKPAVFVHVRTDTTLGLNDWRLRSSVAEVRNS